jgi:translocation and assembly module TamB
LGPGSLASRGGLASYSLSGNGLVRGAGLGAARWSLEASGDGDGLQAAPLHVSGERGELELAGRLAWQGPPAVDLSYRATALELTAVHPGLPPSLNAHGRLAGRLEGEAWSLDTLTLALEQGTLQLELDGVVKLPAGGAPDLLATLRWRDLRWPLVAGDPAYSSPAGSLMLAGVLDDYRVSFNAVIEGSDIPPGEWRGEGAGDGDGLRVKHLQGVLLGGELALTGAVNWAPEPGWTLRAEGQDLNPGEWLPDLPGLLALSLRSHGRSDPDDGLVADLQLDYFGGRLAGREFSLRAQVEPIDDGLALQSLLLRNGGNELTARGQLMPRLALDWTARVPAPEQLLPGSRGTLAATGTVAGSAGSPLVQATVHGTDLGLRAHSLDLLDGQLRFGLAPNDPLSLALDLGVLQQAGVVLLQSAGLQAWGTNARHTLELGVQAPDASLQAQLEGGLEFATASWQGRLAEVGVETVGHGNWQLAAPAQLGVAAANIDLGESCLQSLTDAALVCARGAWAQSGGASIAARMEALPLQRLLPNLSGALDGELDASMAADGALQGRAVLAMSPGQLQVNTGSGARRLQHDGGHLDLAVDTSGLAASIGLEAAGEQRVVARVELPGFNRLPLAESQPLAGHIAADFPDLGGLQALVPELGASGGRLRADLQLAGTLQRPGMIGEVVLAGGRADIPAAGLKLRDIELRASGDRERPGELALTGSLRSGPGRVDVAGRVELTGEVVELALKGDNVELFSTADARVLSSPDLNLAWRDQLLTLRGRILIPEAAITPKLGLSTGPAAGDPVTEPAPDTVVLASADVVVLGAEGEIAASAVPLPVAPVPIDSQVELVIGDKVKINALGLVGRLTGAVTFTNTPGQTDLIPLADGRLSIEAGTFRAFGQDLEIETGRLIYVNAPVTDPEISLRAIRQIDNDPQLSAAGVMVSGSPGSPTLTLFSRPQLDPVEVQSYLLTGRSAGGRDSVLSIGTYLHPRVYVNYGYNLLEETNEFHALYTITPRYGVGANVGEFDNNVNLIFSIER